MSRLSSEDATLISKIFRYRFEDGVPRFHDFEAIYRPLNLTLDDFLHLESLGLLTGVSASAFGRLHIEVSKGGSFSTFFQCGTFALHFYGESTGSTGVTCFSLSQAGLEILSLLPVDDRDAVIHDVAKYASKKIMTDYAVDLKSLNIVMVKVGVATSGVHVEKVEDVAKYER